MNDGIDGGKPVRRTIDPDPYPSGVYSALSYPPAAAAAPPTGSGPGSAAAGGPGSTATSTGSASAGSASGAPGPDGSAEVLARIGDVDVTATVVRTPAGALTLAVATVEVARGRVVRTPTWAVFCAVVGFFVVPVASLLFLLARETVEDGPTVVRISGAGIHHETLVTDPAEIELARSLAAS
ncbi:hypothetical protein ACNTMW_22155 [Planosporangium sp. 12N6]|uniref:hypothetical protein n=1 Tax=Planosporangium spinosum TaxID=3402278 RepID=UPI003CEEF3F1